MNYDHNKKFGLLKFHSGYGNLYSNSPKGYYRKIINAQTDSYFNNSNINCEPKCNQFRVYNHDYAIKWQMP